LTLFFNSLNNLQQQTGPISQNQETIMDKTRRILLGIGILLVDLIVFFLPLSAIFLMYIIIFNPPWFRDFLNNLDRLNSAH